jgi:hypothetical protein
MNRVRQEAGPEETRPDAGDYFVIDARNNTWYVSTAMARFIESVLDAEVRALWVSFVDLTGARVRVRTGEINAICQCTAGQRAKEREFGRSLNRERKADRDWEEQD